jgi:hypothetical protein
MATGLVVVTGGICAAGLAAFLGASGVKERVVLGVVATLCALPLAIVVLRVPAMVRGTGIEIDADGVRPFDGRRSALVPWSAIGAVGLGSDLVSLHGTKRPSVPAFEIYLRHADIDPDDAAAGYPDLRSDWQAVGSPADGLSAGCFSYRLVAATPTASHLEAAVCRRRPELWHGTVTHDRPTPV